jgi:hypothetical protein
MSKRNRSSVPAISFDYFRLHGGSNSTNYISSGKTNSCKFIIFTTNILLMVGDIFIGDDAFLMTDFINLKMKLIQSFKGVIEVKYAYVFIRVS